jgi:hypothetical protein
MNMIKTALVAAAAVPAILFVGAGNAQAGEYVWWDLLPYGLQAHVKNPGDEALHCRYNAEAVNNPWLPNYVHEFELPPAPAQHDWLITAYGFPFAAVPTGTNWHTTVVCKPPGLQGFLMTDEVSVF